MPERRIRSQYAPDQPGTNPGPTPPNLEHMARDTVRLAVRHIADQSSTCLTFEHTAGTTHSLSVYHLGISGAAALLAPVQPQLRDVHTAMISHVALEPLVRFLGGLPKLEHLFVHIVPKNERSSARTFVWSHLLWLPEIADAVPTLRAITLHVWCRGYPKSSLANAEHAVELISHLRALPAGLPPIEVQGFPADQVESLDISGLNLRFNLSAKVGDLVLHKPRKAYDPFRVELDWDL